MELPNFWFFSIIFSICQLSEKTIKKIKQWKKKSQIFQFFKIIFIICQISRGNN